MSRSPKRSVTVPPDARSTASGAAVSQAHVPMCINGRRQAGSSFLKKTEKARFQSRRGGFCYRRRR